jgi:hypothetical protein
MICIFFWLLFDIFHLLVKFILSRTRATINSCLVKNYVDMALGNFDGIV